MSAPPKASQSGQDRGRPFRDPPWKFTNRATSSLYNRSLRALGFLRGNGVPQSEAEAFRWNAEAAHAGHRDAVLAMGWFYLNGIGVERNVELARKWYRKSARHGDERALYSLGEIAYRESDFAAALAWFRRASAAGDGRSLYWLGKHYWHGRGVEQNRKEAMRLFSLAAGGNVHEAQRAVRFLTRSRQNPIPRAQLTQ
jgi:TPR repeat protein